MFTSVKEIAERFGLSERQVYIRLEQLDSILVGHVKRGEKNAKLLDDFAVALIDRVNQLENDGVLLSDAVKQVIEETHNLNQKSETQDVDQREPARETDHAEELINHLKNENEFLRGELQRTLGIVENTQAMLPKKSESRTSRWEHLKSLITGK